MTRSSRRRDRAGGSTPNFPAFDRSTQPAEYHRRASSARPVGSAISRRGCIECLPRGGNAPGDRVESCAVGPWNITLRRVRYRSRRARPSVAPLRSLLTYRPTDRLYRDFRGTVTHCARSHFGVCCRMDLQRPRDGPLSPRRRTIGGTASHRALSVAFGNAEPAPRMELHPICISSRAGNAGARNAIRRCHAAYGGHVERYSIVERCPLVTSPSDSRVVGHFALHQQTEIQPPRRENVPAPARGAPRSRRPSPPLR